MRSGFGSWTFVITFSAFLGAWMVLNSGLILGHHAWDRYPWILLNLMLSCLAALQGALILIAAKRADRVAAELSSQHYEETNKIDQLLQQNTDLTREIHQLMAQFKGQPGGGTSPVERRSGE